MGMNGQIRRYVFVDFDTLRKVKFKKLEKVCDKIFVFVSEAVEQVPMPLVREMQHMGNSVKWVTIAQAASSEMNYHICFLLGKLHEKISLDVEFAILSNDTTFDPLVQFVNQTGRNCLRVRQKESETIEPDTPKPLQATIPAPLQTLHAAHELPNFSLNSWAEDSLLDTPLSNADIAMPMPEIADVSTLQAEALVQQTAAETIQRLLRSGNRPAELSLLRNYILLHNREPDVQQQIDQVIRRLQDNQSIEVVANRVNYHF